MITTGISGEIQRMSNPLDHRGRIKRFTFLSQEWRIFHNLYTTLDYNEENSFK